LSGYVKNVRDLGGIPVAGGAVECGAIYRGGPLKDLMAPGCEQVATLGVKTILDLRMPSEQSSTPTSACVPAERVSAPLPIPYGLGPADYLADFNEVASIAQVFHTFGDPAAYPIYFHCTFGRDRTGVVGALLLSALGASRQDIVADYMLSQASVGAYPDSLAAVLDEIEARGGAEAVLAALGITPEELAVLRSHVSPAP
jgi:protein-tyrosine phosphatase